MPSILQTLEGPAKYWSLKELEKNGYPQVSHLPYSLKILLESLLRNHDGKLVTDRDIENLARWNPSKPAEVELPFMPSRVLLQDFTGVPCVVDLAAMREEVKRRGGDPSRINPLIPVDLVIDHSIQVDTFGTSDAAAKNAAREFERNRERYEFLRWGQKSFKNFRVVPPATGIVHQVNLEYLANVVHHRNGEIFPDTLVGTDSHTTMINGLGVVGWGVGGIEAEAAMLGQPVYLLTPKVVGMALYGQLREGVTATDLVLTITQILRKRGVVDKFVEFYGPGVAHLSLADRATVANMAPEYGATIGYFPIDEETIRYLRGTGRTAQADLTERYAKEQGLWRTDIAPLYSETLMLDLSTIEPSIAGPKRPQDRVSLPKVKETFMKTLEGPIKEAGGLRDGSVIIAAITSCTNTSNPSVMIAAGLLAKKAIERGLSVPWHVKTSLAPGSKVVRGYLEAAGLLSYLERLRFNIVGYGCTTCIGNSGPVDERVERAAKKDGLALAAVLSGNRNFEGRVHASTKANFLASPPLVVAYALAGRVDIDINSEPLGLGLDGRPVYLKDLWPTQEEIRETIHRTLKPELFQSQYGNVENGNETWNAIAVPEGELYSWEETSTYIKEAPFAADVPVEDFGIRGAHALLVVGDSITTDHISPAGTISAEGSTAQYLAKSGVEWKDYNSYGARRGNHEVMVRGTFANSRLKNKLTGGKEGGFTTHIPSGEPMSIFDAAELYRAEGIPAVVIAGKDYGMGSSRDWAAKGPKLLGVRAALFESVERIHRSNLVGMGILPLQFMAGDTAESLGLTGYESFDITVPALAPKAPVRVVATEPNGSIKAFNAILRIDTPIEVEYMKAGGILPYVLKSLF